MQINARSGGIMCKKSIFVNKDNIGVHVYLLLQKRFIFAYKSFKNRAVTLNNRNILWQKHNILNIKLSDFFFRKSDFGLIEFKIFPSN